MDGAEAIGSSDLREPLWPPFVAMLAVAGLYATLPPYLLGHLPPGAIAGAVVVLLLMIVISHRAGHPELHQVLGYVLNSIVTAAMIYSLVLLIKEVTKLSATPERLLSSAAALWLSNILVSAAWYWRLDGGGPHKRAGTQGGHTDGAFLFPQMTMPPDVKRAAGEEEWQPNFVDYLFLAFNTSTAFSPTDVPVLSRWAKVVMMIQSLISLLVIAVLAGRAINILGQGHTP